MPDGLDDGALGFLCFGWATEAVAVAAARGTAYFFGGMAAGWEASGREIDGRNGENGREVGKSGNKRREEAPTHRQGGPTRPFRLCRRPRRPPGRRVLPGSAGTSFGPSRRKTGFWGGGVRLGLFFGAGAAKTPGEDLLGRGWRCS